MYGRVISDDLAYWWQFIVNDDNAYAQSTIQLFNNIKIVGVYLATRSFILIWRRQSKNLTHSINDALKI